MRVFCRFSRFKVRLAAASASDASPVDPVAKDGNCSNDTASVEGDVPSVTVTGEADSVAAGPDDSDPGKTSC